MVLDHDRVWVSGYLSRNMHIDALIINFKYFYDLGKRFALDLCKITLASILHCYEILPDNDNVGSVDVSDLLVYRVGSIKIKDGIHLKFKSRK